MIKKIDLGFTELEIHKGYFLGRAKEAISVSLDKHLEVLDVVNKYLSPPYGMILDEINSYSVEFEVMSYLKKDPNVICVGVIFYRNVTKVTLGLGKKYIDKPVKLSRDRDEIICWVKEQLKN